MALCPSTLAVVALVALALLAIGPVRASRPLTGLGFDAADVLYFNPASALEHGSRSLLTQNGCPSNLDPIFVGLPSGGGTITGCGLSSVPQPTVSAFLTVSGSDITLTGTATCNQTLDVTSVTDIGPGACPTVTQTYTASLPCFGYSASTTILNTLNPPAGGITVTTANTQQTYDCRTQSPPAVPTTVSSNVVNATDGCNNAIPLTSITASASAWSNAPTCAWSATVTYTATDCAGNTGIGTSQATLTPTNAGPVATLPSDVLCSVPSCPTGPLTTAQLTSCTWTTSSGLSASGNVTTWLAQFAVNTPQGCADVAGDVFGVTTTFNFLSLSNPTCVPQQPLLVGTGMITGSNECNTTMAQASILVRVCETCQATSFIRSPGFWQNRGARFTQACNPIAQPFINVRINSTLTSYYCLGNNLFTCISTFSGQNQWRVQLAATFANIFCPASDNGIAFPTPSPPLNPAPARNPSFSVAALTNTTLLPASSCPAYVGGCARANPLVITYFELYQCSYNAVLSNAALTGPVAGCLGAVISVSENCTAGSPFLACL